MREREREEGGRVLKKEKRKKKKFTCVAVESIIFIARNVKIYFNLAFLHLWENDPTTHKILLLISLPA